MQGVGPREQESAGKIAERYNALVYLGTRRTLEEDAEYDYLINLIKSNKR